jgi:hypothetical protein
VRDKVVFGNNDTELVALEDDTAVRRLEGGEVRVPIADKVRIKLYTSYPAMTQCKAAMKVHHPKHCTPRLHQDTTNDNESAHNRLRAQQDEHFRI